MNEFIEGLVSGCGLFSSLRSGDIYKYQLLIERTESA